MKKCWTNPAIYELDLNATAGDVYSGKKPDGEYDCNDYWLFEPPDGPPCCS